MAETAAIDGDTADWVDLTQPFDADVPHSAALPAPEFETLSDVDRDGVNAPMDRNADSRRDTRRRAPTHDP